MWQTYAFLSAFCAALTAIFAKLGVRNIDSTLATGIRTIFILFLTWILILFNGSFKTIRDISASSWIFLVLSAIATGLSWLFYFRALQLGEVSKVAPVDKLSVPLTVFLAFMFLGEQPDWQIILGASLVTAGTLVLIL